MEKCANPRCLKDLNLGFQLVRDGQVVASFCFGESCLHEARKRAKEIEAEMLAAEQLCTFNVEWIGPCGAAVKEKGLCEKHWQLMCCWPDCKNQPRRTCPHAISLCCGRPVCHLPEHACCPEHMPEEEAPATPSVA